MSKLSYKPLTIESHSQIVKQLSKTIDSQRKTIELSFITHDRAIEDLNKAILILKKHNLLDEYFKS